MSHRHRTSRAVRCVPVLGVAAALLLTACGSGQTAEVYQERTVADATNESVGAIAVRNLAIEAPLTGSVLQKGTDAPLTVTLVNGGSDSDVLLSASTPAAASVRVVGPTSTVPVPALSAASSAYSLVLGDLTRDLPSGSYISLTLVFRRNGSKTLLVPVSTTYGGAPRPTSTYDVPNTDSAGSPIVSSPSNG